MKHKAVGKIILLTFVVGISAVPINAAQVEGTFFDDSYSADIHSGQRY